MGLAAEPFAWLSSPRTSFRWQRAALILGERIRAAAIPVLGNLQPYINRSWIQQLMSAASGPNGLTVLPEPDEPVDSTPGSPVTAETSRMGSQRPR